MIIIKATHTVYRPTQQAYTTAMQGCRQPTKETPRVWSFDRECWGSSPNKWAAPPISPHPPTLETSWLLYMQQLPKPLLEQKHTTTTTTTAANGVHPVVASTRMQQQNHHHHHHTGCLTAAAKATAAAAAGSTHKGVHFPTSSRQAVDANVTDGAERRHTHGHAASPPDQPTAACACC